MKMTKRAREQHFYAGKYTLLQPPPRPNSSHTDIISNPTPKSPPQGWRADSSTQLPSCSSDMVAGPHPSLEGPARALSNSPSTTDCWTDYRPRPAFVRSLICAPGAVFLFVLFRLRAPSRKAEHLPPCEPSSCPSFCELEPHAGPLGRQHCL